MGNKTSRGEKANNHVAFSTDRGPIPNIVITQPTPLAPPEGPNPFVAPPPSPRIGHYHYPETPTHRAPPPTPRNAWSPITPAGPITSSDETMILAGTPPPDHPPPPPPIQEEERRSHEDIYSKYTSFASSVLNGATNPSAPVAAPRTALPTIKRNIVYAKDRIAQFEALNTTDRKKDPGFTPQLHRKEKDHTSIDYYSIKGAKPSDYARFKPFSSTVCASATVNSKCSSQTETTIVDDYPVYNPIQDFNFKSGTTFHNGTHPIDANRINIGFVGRQGAGKSTMINALRGISIGDAQSAGRNACDYMEPFRFIEEELQSMVLWEIPYPRTFSVDVYDRNMGFDRFYESHKFNLFHRIYVLIPDGAPRDDDVYFARVVQSRRTPITFLFTKTDDDLDSEVRESGRSVEFSLKKDYENRAKSVFMKSLQTKAQILTSINVLFISSHVIRNLVSGTTGYLHYKMDEEKLLKELDVKLNCHCELEHRMRREKKDAELRSASRATSDYGGSAVYSSIEPRPNRLPMLSGQNAIQKSSVLVDAGFEILYGTDDRVFGNMEPRTTVTRAGRTAFNYGFIGCTGVGKSSMINAMRGMSIKHPLAAGRTKVRPGGCDRFEFDDDLLKYNVTLWELHYPKKINEFFEFIDRHNISAFTAVFVLIDGIPTDMDLSFSKIAHRRNASVVFLSSKSDKKLASRSRSDEIPVCDLLKQRFVDKGIARFDRALASSAPELCGRVHAFFVSAPVFRALRTGDARMMPFILHERAVFDFLKQKRMIADLLESPCQLKEGLYANVNTDTAGTEIRDEIR